MAHEHKDHSALFATFFVEKKPRSLVVIKGEIPEEELKSHEGHVLAHMGQDVEMKGFRKGHIPENMLRKQIGEMALLSEVAEHTLSHLYPSMLKHFKLDAIGRPSINVEKLAPGNPFGFSVEVAVIPEFTAPDYKALAHGVNENKGTATITDEDVQKAIENVQRQKIAYDRLQEKARQKQTTEQATKDGLTLPTPETVSDKNETDEDTSKLPVPELTEEYVKTLGAFETIDAFKTQIRVHLEKEKMDEVVGKHRAALTDALIEKMDIDLPQVLLDSELSQMFGQMEEDLSRAGLTIEGYLEHVKKTREDMIKEWTPAAEKRAKTQLLLNKIAEEEAIVPSAEEIEREANLILEQYKDADRTRVRIYVASVLQNGEVMKFLESQ